MIERLGAQSSSPDCDNLHYLLARQVKTLADAAPAPTMLGRWRQRQELRRAMARLEWGEARAEGRAAATWEWDSTVPRLLLFAIGSMLGLSVLGGTPFDLHLLLSRVLVAALLTVPAAMVMAHLAWRSAEKSYQEECNRLQAWSHSPPRPDRVR